MTREQHCAPDKFVGAQRWSRSDYAGVGTPPPEPLTWKPEEPAENPRFRIKVKKSPTLENIGTPSLSVEQKRLYVMNVINRL
ncbi:hypothetical protein GS469_00905 [Rhodococcus hoagii]|nr:hypothetical protein [Prescottella equi]